MTQYRIQLLLIPFALFVFYKATLSAEKSQSRGENIPYFVKAANEITDWFKYLSASYDDITKKEERTQLIERVYGLANDLYKLEIDRAAFIESILKFIDEEPNSKITDQLRSEYNEKTKLFQQQMQKVEKQLNDFGADLRAHGIKGLQVEKIIRFGFHYKSELDGTSIHTPKFNAYGPMKGSYNKNEVREESKRCIEALRGAQIAASQFLEHLRKE